MKKDVLSFVTDILVCGCVGICIDYFANTTFIFTLIGLVAGVGLAFILKNRRKG